MEKLISRYIILSVILALGAVIVNFLNYNPFYKTENAVGTISKIPLQIGKWHGRDVPLDTRIYDILETKAIINRNYISDGHSVFLSLVYYPETKVDFHAPEGCLAGRGVQISKSMRSVFIHYQGTSHEIKVNQLIRRDKGSEELFFYFYKAGDFMGENYIRLRFELALNKFSRTRKSGSLIRISTPLKFGDYDNAGKVLTEFLEELYPYLIKYL